MNEYVLNMLVWENKTVLQKSRYALSAMYAGRSLTSVKVEIVLRHL